MNKKAILLIFGDITCLYLSLWMSFIIRQHAFSTNALMPFSLLFIIWLIIFYIAGFNEMEIIADKLKFYSLFWKTISINISIAIFLFYINIYPFNITPKRILFFQIAIFALLSWLWREAFRSILRHFPKNLLLVSSDAKTALKISKLLTHNPNYNLVGTISHTANFKKVIKDKNAQVVLLADNPYQNNNIIAELFKCVPIQFYDLPTFYEKTFKKIPIHSVSQLWFLQNLTNHRLYDIAKRATDIIFATIILIISAPFLLIIAFLIKWDSTGNVFYKQKRVGKNNKEFMVWKFRTMVENAEAKGPQWAKNNDNRITKIGKLLRKMRIDELPQIVNIFKGEMSLVGPRPERPEFISKLVKSVPFYSVRHLIKPGLTGWAQIKFHYGSSIEDAKEKLRYDLYYIKNRSVALDFGIILRTIKVVLGMEGN